MKRQCTLLPQPWCPWQAGAGGLMQLIGISIAEQMDPVCVSVSQRLSMIDNALESQPCQRNPDFNGSSKNAFIFLVKSDPQSGAYRILKKREQIGFGV